jgi:hypothetical protein
MSSPSRPEASDDRQRSCLVVSFCLLIAAIVFMLQGMPIAALICLICNYVAAAIGWRRKEET